MPEIHFWGWSLFGHLLTVLTFVLALILGTWILRSNRVPQATWAWLLVIVLIPYLGIPLFLLFGRRKFGRQALHNVFALRSSASQFLTSGEDTFQRLLQAIGEAQQNIDICIFIFSRDEVATTILQELIRAAGRGVRVRLLVDAFGSSFLVRPSFQPLLKAGGQIRFFGPLLHKPWRSATNLRNHRKLAIFDRTQAWVGGMNIAQEYMGPTSNEKRWVDIGLWIKGVLVEDVQSLFESDWQSVVIDPAPPTAPPTRITTGNLHWGEASTSQLVISGPDTEEDALYESILQFCYQARQTLWVVTPYFIPDENLERALLIAAKRGVDVAVVVPCESNHPLADWARSDYLRQLQKGGCRILLYPRMIHAKAVVIDQSTALIASANFDMRSLLYNYEMGIVVRGPSEVQPVHEWIQSLQEQSSSWQDSAHFIFVLIESLARTLAPLI